MPQYDFLLLEPDGRVMGREIYFCEDDLEALAAAYRLNHCNAVEVIGGGHKLATVPKGEAAPAALTGPSERYGQALPYLKDRMH